MENSETTEYKYNIKANSVQYIFDKYYIKKKIKNKGIFII